jgi:hypothetical protein
MGNASKNAAKKKKNYLTIIGVFTPIIVAIVGCVSAIAGTEPFASWMVRLLPTMATPTPMVVFAASMQSAIVDATPSFAPQLSSQPDYVPGKDWLANCLNAKWVAYPSANISSNNGCLQEPIWDSISTRNGGLYIFAQPRGLIVTKEYGIFVQLPQSAAVRVNVDLDAVKNGQVWFGVFGEPTIASAGVFIIAPPGDVTKHAFAVKDSISQRALANSKYYENALGAYSLGFDVSNGVVTAIVENETLRTVSFPSPHRWLFIGYRANLDITNGSADIQALFSNLTITQ